MGRKVMKGIDTYHLIHRNDPKRITEGDLPQLFPCVDPCLIHLFFTPPIHFLLSLLISFYSLTNLIGLVTKINWI